MLPYNLILLLSLNWGTEATIIFLCWNVSMNGSMNLENIRFPLNLWTCFVCVCACVCLKTVELERLEHCQKFNEAEIKTHPWFFNVFQPSLYIYLLPSFYELNPLTISQTCTLLFETTATTVVQANVIFYYNYYNVFCAFGVTPHYPQFCTQQGWSLYCKTKRETNDWDCFWNYNYLEIVGRKMCWKESCIEVEKKVNNHFIYGRLKYLKLICTVITSNIR